MLFIEFSIGFTTLSHCGLQVEIYFSLILWRMCVAWGSIKNAKPFLEYVTANNGCIFGILSSRTGWKTSPPLKCGHVWGKNKQRSNIDPRRQLTEALCNYMMTASLSKSEDVSPCGDVCKSCLSEGNSFAWPHLITCWIQNHAIIYIDFT